MRLIRSRIGAAAAVAVMTAACVGGGSGPEISAPPTTLPIPTAATLQLDPASYEMRSAQFMLTCVEEQGVTGTVTGDGGLSLDPVPFEQRDRVDQVVSECRSRLLTELPPEPEPTTEAEWRRRYDQQVETARCLARYGIVSDIPSFESWMESKGENWVAYDALGNLSREEWYGINQACPQP